MDNPTESELSNPASTSPAPPAPTAAPSPSPCTTPDLAPHPVTSQFLTRPQTRRQFLTLPQIQLQLLIPLYLRLRLPLSLPLRLPDNLMYKNRLQEYTQKSSLQLPVYQTFNEGPAHMPRFRSTVWVDGARYRSQRTFLHRKAAEQDVANLALESILNRVKDEGCPLLLGVCEKIANYILPKINQGEYGIAQLEHCVVTRMLILLLPCPLFSCVDTVFCKSILNEFAVKVNWEKPTYNTVQSPGLLPVFISTLVFDGVSYTGDGGRNKKEAEQLAARAVILSLLGNSGSSKILYEIIKSKSKLYAALDRVKDPSHSQPNIVPVAVKVGHCSETTVDQEQEGSTGVVRDAVPVSAIAPAASGMHPSHHVPKRPRPDPHPVSEQPLGVDFGSSSAKKKRKNKKKANKETDTQFPTDAIPLNQASPCSVAQ
ncbi:double-stranded RNA-binding protein 4-like isoform X1 [Populus alba x Populus x berolinensis]|nr:double-stranded RNA-binding protein 4-like isoform X1 [Populus alba x Populus x berolinensis]